MTKKGIIYETLGNVQSLQVMESQNPAEVRLSGIFGVCGIKNGNNRIYEKSNYGKMVSILKEQISSGEGVLGELEHPNTMNITLDNVSHVIEDIAMNEDGTVTGTIRLLDTPKGKIAKAIIEGGCPLYISSRGAGSIDESGHVTLTTIKTYDLVGTPGFSQAKLTLSNNQKFESLCESKDDGNMWMIVEEDDDILGGDDNKPSEKDDKSPDNDDEKTKKDKSSEKGDKPSDNDDAQKKETNNDTEDITMNDIKNAIDSLTSKVEKLEAELHVAQEAKETAEKALSEAQGKVIDYDSVQQWIEEEYMPEIKSEIMEAANNAITEAIKPLKESITDGVEKWATTEFSESLQNWIVNEYSSTIEKWITEEFAPENNSNLIEKIANGIQGWITEEFAPQIQGWITEEFAPEQAAEINKNVSEYIESLQDESKYTHIDEMLESLTKYGAEGAEKILKESQSNEYSNVPAIQGMPANMRPMWEALSNERKEEIVRESRMYDFTKKGVMESFWATRKLDADKVIESKKQDEAPIVESKYAGIFRQAMKMRTK